MNRKCWGKWFEALGMKHWYCLGNENIYEMPRLSSHCPGCGRQIDASYGEPDSLEQAETRFLVQAKVKMVGWQTIRLLDEEEVTIPIPCRMPPRFLEPAELVHDGTKIGDMKIGEMAWIVPWSIIVAEDGRCFVRLGCTVCNSPGGTVDTLITRTRDGYVANIAGTSHKWLPRSLSHIGVMEGKLELAPIVRLDTTEYRQKSTVAKRSR